MHLPLPRCLCSVLLSATSHSLTHSLTHSPAAASAAGKDVVCVAQNDAVLEGLLCVFHVERSGEAGNVDNVQVGVDGWTCV